MTNRLKQRLAQGKDSLKRLVWRRKAPAVEDRLDESKLMKIKDLLLKGRVNSVARSMYRFRSNVKYVAELLKDENSDVRRRAANALGNTADKGTDISSAITGLGNALIDKELGVRLAAASALADAAANELDISGVIPNLADALKNDADVAENAAKALNYAAVNGEDISGVIEYVLTALRDGDAMVKWRASWGLGEAAEKGIDISAAIPELVNALRNEDADVRCGAARALGGAAKSGVDISSAIPALGSILGTEDADVRNYVSHALFAAAHGTDAARELITAVVMDFVDSEWFMIEASRNSRTYIDLIKKLDEIMQVVRAAEQRERAA